MKSFIDKIPRLHLYTLAVLVIFLLIQSGLRLIFWSKFNNPADPISSHDLLWSFYLGMKFDLQASLGTLLPVLLLGWIKPLHPVYSHFGKRLWAFYISLALVIMYLVYITDAGHYAYLQQQVAAAWSNVVVLEGTCAVAFDLDRWRALPLSLQRSLLREAIRRLRRSLRNIGWVHIDNAIGVLQRGSTGGVQGDHHGVVAIEGEVGAAEIQRVAPDSILAQIGNFL